VVGYRVVAAQTGESGESDDGAMSVKHAVLGLVIERPGHGYALAQRLNERCGSWQWERSGVYSALDRLEEESYVLRAKARAGASASRRAPSTVYEATDRGRDFFGEWVLASSPPSPFRQDLDLKLLLAGPEFLPRLIDLTWAQEQQCAAELQRLVSQGPAGASIAQSSWAEIAVALQRRGEIRVLQARVEWLQDTRSVMKELLMRSNAPRR